MTTTQTPTETPMSLSDWLSALAFLAMPYLLAGLFWADRQSPGVQAAGYERTLTYAGHVIAWPLLIFTDIDVIGLHLT